MQGEKCIHFNEIDRMRGIAIILVVLGHSSPQHQIELNPTWFQILYKFIYSFHMPLFFFISGFCFYSIYSTATAWKEKAEAVLKKAKRLVIPYFFYSLVTLILKTVFSQYANNPFQIDEVYKILLGQNPNGGLWFLWILFVILVILLVLNKIPLYITLVITLILKWGTGNWLIHNNLLIKISTYAIFVVLGLIFYKYYGFLKKIKVNNVYVVAILYLLGAIVSQYSISIIVELLCAVVAIMATWMLSNNIRDNVKIDKVLRIGSEYSMDIYLLSYFIQVPIRVMKLHFIPIPYGITFLLMFVLGGVIPIIISKYIIRNNKILALVFLGRGSK